MRDPNRIIHGGWTKFQISQILEPLEFDRSQVRDVPSGGIDIESKCADVWSMETGAEV